MASTTCAVLHIAANDTRSFLYALRHRDGRVTDADQRIAEEVKVAADAFAELFGRAIMPSIDLLWFSASLYRLMGARGVAYLAAYAALSASVARVFQPDVETLGRKENELSSMYVLFTFRAFCACTRAFVCACVPAFAAHVGTARRILLVGRLLVPRATLSTDPNLSTNTRTAC